MIVAKIIDDYRIVVNAGLNQNINTGDLLIVYEQGEEVKDPETGENLGVLEVTKAVLKVARSYENMSLCVNADKIRSLQDYSNSGIPKPLPINAEEISGGWSPTPIRVKDKVRRVSGQEGDYLKSVHKPKLNQDSYEQNLQP